mmetsp:Transcript_24011/g.70840  ORF Transcript_24011/g.70840 Transcript_24011/m.70840 type:complete len:111 (-) Transcript_24011:225-557(-)
MTHHGGENICSPLSNLARLDLISNGTRRRMSTLLRPALKYQVSTAEKPSVQNYTTLILCGFDMVQTMGSKNQVPKLRGRSRRIGDDDNDDDSDPEGYDRGQRSYKTTNDS